MPAARAAASVHNVRAAARPSRAAARRPQRAAPAGAAGEGRGEDEAAHAAGGGVGGGLSAALESLEAAADAGMLDANAMGELAGIVGAAGDGAVGAAQTNASEAAPRTACQAFHLAIPVHDIEAARAFYGPGGALGLAEGRRSARWQDYDLFGHQLVLHQVDGYEGAAAQSGVDGDPVPVPHFGLALSTGAFHALAARVAASGVTFEVAPHGTGRRARGRPAREQAGGRRC